MMKCLVSTFIQIFLSTVKVSIEKCLINGKKLSHFVLICKFKTRPEMLKYKFAWNCKVNNNSYFWMKWYFSLLLGVVVCASEQYDFQGDHIKVIIDDWF